MAGGRVWKPRYCAPAVITLGEIGYALTPIHTMLVSWQPLQPELMPLWICTPVGTGVANKVPGAVRVLDAGIRPGTLLVAWQASQAVLDGMCEPAPAGLVRGMPTMRLMPAKAVTVLAVVWQATQLLVMPAWLIKEPLKRAPLPTGSTVIDEPAPT